MNKIIYDEIKINEEKNIKKIQKSKIIQDISFDLNFCEKILENIIKKENFKKKIDILNKNFEFCEVPEEESEEKNFKRTSFYSEEEKKNFLFYLKKKKFLDDNDFKIEEKMIGKKIFSQILEKNEKKKPKEKKKKEDFIKLKVEDKIIYLQNETNQYQYDKENFPNSNNLNILNKLYKYNFKNEKKYFLERKYEDSINNELNGLIFKNFDNFKKFYFILNNDYENNNLKFTNLFYMFEIIFILVNNMGNYFILIIKNKKIYFYSTEKLDFIYEKLILKIMKNIFYNNSNFKIIQKKMQKGFEEKNSIIISSFLKFFFKFSNFETFLGQSCFKVEN
jgi:hypothetical protein